MEIMSKEMEITYSETTIKLSETKTLKLEIIPKSMEMGTTMKERTKKYSEMIAMLWVNIHNKDLSKIYFHQG